MNENKFTGKAELYSKYRPSYPEKLIDWLYDMTNAEAVEDIGAGTGIFTSALLKKPWSVTAVEPNSDMLSVLKKLWATGFHKIILPNVISVHFNKF